MSPLYHIVRVLPSCPRQLDRGPLDGSVPSGLPDPIKTIKSKAEKATRGLSAPFLYSLIFARSPTDAKRLRRTRCGRCLRCASRYALRCEVWLLGQYVMESCMPCKMSCVFVAQLALVSAVLLESFVQVVLITWSPLASNSALSIYIARSSDSTKLLLSLNYVLRHCIQYVIVVTVSGALFICQSNHHLVDWRDFRNHAIAGTL